MDEKRTEQLRRTVERGLEAQHFLQFVDREPYFKMLFNELDQEYVTAMLGLQPHQTEEFRYLQTKRMALYEPINRAAMDVQIMQKANDELENPEGMGGIL